MADKIKMLGDACDEAQARWLSVRNNVRDASRDIAEQQVEAAANAYLAAKLATIHIDSVYVDNKGRRLKYDYEAVQAELETTLCRMEELGLVDGYGDASGTAREQADAIAARQLACDRADAAEYIWGADKRRKRSAAFKPKRTDKKRRASMARASALFTLGRK